MGDQIEILKYGELFCGPGGLACGAMQSTAKDENGKKYKIEHAWANDYHPDSCATYRNRFCPYDPDTVKCGDVSKLNINFLGDIDVFAYGFPCNDFSIVGEQKGFDGKFGPLYTYGVKVIKRYKPKFFIAENVGGLSSANEGAAFKKIIRDLSKAGDGYELTAHKYRAEDYGVPQTRHRIIIVGFQKNLNKKYSVPKPTHLNNPVTSKEALEQPLIKVGAFNHELKRQMPQVVERLKHIKPGENAWTAKLPERLQLKVGNAKLSQIYKRLDPNKPSYTMTGSGGGGTHGYHYDEPRALTNRERARIQTFPDNYEFKGSIESVRKQIGMAVPPKLARVVFTAALKTYAGVKYPSIAPNLDI